MPPKLVAELVALFQSIGLEHKKAVDAVGSAKTSQSLRELIETNQLNTLALDAKRGTLISGFAVQAPKLGPAERSYAVRAIVDGKLKSADQVAAATKYLETHTAPINDAEFDDSCGVGFAITNEEMYSSVSEYIKSAAVTGWSNLSGTLGNLRSHPKLRWANALEVKTTVERVFEETFGVKTVSPQSASKASTETETIVPAAPPAKTVFEEGFLGALHKPGENPQLLPHLRAEHLAATGGKVFTRFPPEPNGYLHIGHSKAIFVNFGYAAHHGGKCYLRYDDTNPEAEEARYFESILEVVRWLGFEPFRITYSSDYFQQLYDLGVELIRRDKGYCCSCTAEEIHRDRGGEEHGPRRACVHRNRPIEESLKIFDDMKNGKYARGEMTMRMKQNLEDGNFQMWDLVAYRVVNAPHHRTGATWCIYPTYDFTHCLCDSFENISHSLCTTEFIDSRVSYEWLCDAVEIYKPRQSEYGRLNIEGTVMSKRKLLRLVKEGHVNGWDDPRMYTLVALRRRGIPPGAIVNFVSGLGVSTSPSNIEMARFENVVRNYLENSVSRLMMVLRPLKVIIEDLTEDEVIWVERPLHTKVPELGTSRVPLTKTVYIDAGDFRLEDSKDYFRLAPGKSVGLLNAPYPVVYVSHTTDPATKTVTEVRVRFDKEAKKPKGFVQWVALHAASGSPVVVDETRIYNRLFKSDKPASSPDYIADINPDSLEIVKGANSGHGDEPHASADQLVGNECVRFQGMRDSTVKALREPVDVAPRRHEGDVIVLNRIVSLKEDSGKAGV
ncbi:glutaminyl-tRNA synthetase [Auriculariales sp. MPI-PUGE-AT-0066]|nr:glutaminyl-tRNA synthetase [Auriculariales sp. MPI-PUGE-AT-0066]